jgi:hypothetical protein
MALGSVHSAWNQGTDLFVDGAGAKASRLLRRKIGTFVGHLGIPADASGAYRPNPKATTNLVHRPLH